MTPEVKAPRAEVRGLRRVIVKLVRAVYTHTRTDLAPDAALPDDVTGRKR